MACSELFADRVLPFDTDAARHHTALAVAARNAGRGFPTPEEGFWLGLQADPDLLQRRREIDADLARIAPYRAA